MTQKEAKRRDGYLRRKYASSTREYNCRNQRQKKKCAICHRSPVNLPLAYDHEHRLAKLKVPSWKHDDHWHAYNEEFHLEATHRVRKKAVAIVRRLLKRFSNRGLLCWACNSGLRKWLDNYEHLLRAGMYLQRHQEAYPYDRTRKKPKKKRRSHVGK